MKIMWLYKVENKNGQVDYYAVHNSEDNKLFRDLGIYTLLGTVKVEDNYWRNNAENVFLD